MFSAVKNRTRRHILASHPRIAHYNQEEKDESQVVYDFLGLAKSGAMRCLFECPAVWIGQAASDKPQVLASKYLGKTLTTAEKLELS
jgi:hypothetical protein